MCKARWLFEISIESFYFECFFFNYKSFYKLIAFFFFFSMWKRSIEIGFRSSSKSSYFVWSQHLNPSLHSYFKNIDFLWTHLERKPRFLCMKISNLLLYFSVLLEARLIMPSPQLYIFHQQNDYFKNIS